MTNVKSVIFDGIKSFCVNKSRYKALYINVHKIDEKYRNSVYKNELETMFLPLVKENLAKSFFAPNDDFLVVYDKTKNDDVLSLLVKIQFLFQEDETIKNCSDLQNMGIAVFYDLESEYSSLSKKIETAIGEEKDTEKDAEKPVNIEQNLYKSKTEGNRKELTTEMLAKVRKIISRSDFSSYIRRQAVCAIIGKSAPQRVFEEVFVSDEMVRDSLLPGVNIKSNPWLNLVLSDTLNRRVLEVVTRHDDGDLSGNFSINISVSSILSDEFIQFDDSINGSMRSTIVLELQLEDIFSDMNSYILAKTFAKARGYKICVDGINVDKLKYINRKSLDCDLMKIQWHNSLIDLFGKDENFMDYANKAERAKIILCNIESQEAIEAGNNLGINLYQGKYVQRLMNEKK